MKIDDRFFETIDHNLKMLQFRLPKKKINGQSYTPINKLHKIIKNVIFHSMEYQRLDTIHMDSIINRSITEEHKF